MAHAGGRPPKYNVEDINKSLDAFVDANTEPLIQEFILNYGISPSRFYDLAKDSQEISDTIKKAITKQELYLIKQTQAGQINPTFAIFRLKQKQFGWTDKQEVETHATNTNYNVDLDADLFRAKATPDELANVDKMSWDEIQGIMRR